MSAPALAVTGLTKQFRGRRTVGGVLQVPWGGARITALDRLTCTVGEGEFFGLLGVNGAGKSTLFKILATLVLPDGGSAAIFGVDVVRQPGRIRSLLAPVLTTDRTLYWRLSAGENLRLFAGLHRLPGAAIGPRIREVLALVGLEAVGDRLVGTFSSGMKQRLLLGRALLSRPRMLLLDEPTRSLDPVAARGFREFLRRDIGHREGCTVLLATHDPDEVRDLCDRVGILHQGRMIAAGTTQGLTRELGYHRYRLSTTMPDHPAILAIPEYGVRLGITVAEADGWSAREMDLPGGAEEASRVVNRLVEAGVTVARFERVELPLAELITLLGQRAETPRDA